MTPTVRMTPTELLARGHGSYAAHQATQTGVLEYLELCGVPAVPVHTGPRVTPRPGGGFDLRKNTAQHGLSDVIACLPPSGRMALIEVKSGRARRSAEQVRLQQRFADAGALCLVVRYLRDLEPYVPVGRVTLQDHGGTR